MSFVDQSSGWQWPAIGATVLAQGALLAVFAAAFHVAQRSPMEPAGASLAVFDLAPPPGDAGEQVGEPRLLQPRQTRSVAPISLPERPLPSALPQKGAAQAAAVAAPLAAAVPEVALPQPSAPPPLPAVSAPEQADALGAYAQALRQRIMARLPAGLHRQGAATVAFSLDTAGRLTSAEVAQSSSDAQLDRMALRMVRAAAPFSAPPASVPEARLRFSIEVRFH